MSFLESYKHLDNLCKDMFSSEKGVTTYIETMEHTAGGSYRITGWDSDYKNLKHYRYIRNRIVHDNYASENSMCTDSDTAWINNFYSRIMNRNDPLALYRKAITPQKVVKPSAPPTFNYKQYQPSKPPVLKNRSWLAPLVICIISLLVGASFHGLRMHPENAEAYRLGCTVGTAAVIISVIAFVVFAVLLAQSLKHKR